MSAENFIALHQDANEILRHTTWLQTKTKQKQNKRRCHFELRPTGALSLDLSADSQVNALLALKSSKALTNQILVSRFHNLTPLGKVVKECIF